MTLPETIAPLAAKLGGHLSVAALHVASGTTVLHDLERRYPAASLIKVPMMATILASAAAGHLDLAEPYALQASDQVGDEGILHKEPVGSIWTLEQILGLMVTVSDNTATNILIDRMGGYEPYQAYFPHLGLSQTVLQRHMFDFAARQAGRDNWTTAGDMFELMHRLARKELVSPAVTRQMAAIMTRQQDREKLPAKLPPEFPIASKPGELPGGVRHDMGVVYTHIGPVVIVMLTEGVDEAIADDTLADIAVALFDEVGGEAYAGG
jgi:beta-lactamase class A